MLDIFGCTHVGYIGMYSCWIYPDVRVLDISGCTRVGYIRMYSCWIYPDVLVLDISGCTRVGYVVVIPAFGVYCGGCTKC